MMMRATSPKKPTMTPMTIDLSRLDSDVFDSAAGVLLPLFVVDCAAEDKVTVVLLASELAVDLLVNDGC